jgi:hypothetical protein
LEDFAIGDDRIIERKNQYSAEMGQQGCERSDYVFLDWIEHFDCEQGYQYQ